MFDVGLSHSEAMRIAVHCKVQPLRPSLWGRIRARLCDDAAWRAVYCGLVWLVAIFCGPVFVAAGLIAVFGG